MSKYTIEDETIYFSYNFDENLEPYYMVLMQVSAISFRARVQKREDLTSRSIFNRRVIDFPTHIESVTFGWEYNKPLPLIPNLEHLEFGHKFNQTVGLGHKLKVLIFGHEFNQPIWVLPKNIQILRFGSKFNQPIQLPPNLILLGLDWNYRCPITIKVRLKYLILDLGIKAQCIVQLEPTKTLEFISFNSIVTNRQMLDKNIIECKTFHYCNWLYFPHILNKNIKRFTSPAHTRCKITKNITHLDIGTNLSYYCLGKKIVNLHVYGCTTRFELPKHLSSLKMSNFYMGTFVLPRFLSVISFGEKYTRSCIMDHLNKKVCIEGFACCPNIIDNLPNNPKIITLNFLTGKKPIANMPNFVETNEGTNYVNTSVQRLTH